MSNIENPGNGSVETNPQKLFQEISDDEVQFSLVLPEKQVFPSYEGDYESLTAKYPDDIENIQRVSEDFFLRAKQYLERPLLTDSFPSHKERTAWQQRKTEDPRIARIYTPVQLENKLRLNNMVGFLQLAEALKLYLTSTSGKVEWKKKEQALALLNELPDLSDYNTISTEAKLERVKKVSDFCERYIELFGKK